MKTALIISIYTAVTILGAGGLALLIDNLGA